MTVPASEQASATFYMRSRRINRAMAYLLAAVSIYVGIVLLGYVSRESVFLPVLVLYIFSAGSAVAYGFALTNTRLTTSADGLEYKRPEYTLRAKWSQVRSVRREAFSSILTGLHSLVLDAPTRTYSRVFGFGHSLSLENMLFPKRKDTIPIGPATWAGYDRLREILQTHLPGLPLDPQ